MKEKMFAILSLLHLCLGCNSDPSVTNKPALSRSDTIATRENNIGIGVITIRSLDDDDEPIQDDTHILDEKGITTIRINFYKNNMDYKEEKLVLSDIENDSIGNDFKPLQFYPEYNIIHFICIGEDSAKYWIKVSEKPDIKLAIRKSEKSTRFYTWPEYIKTASVYFSETFDLYSMPSESSTLKSFSGNVGLSVKEVKGDWVLLFCDLENECEMCDDEKISGWIKWNNGEKLTIDLRFIC